MQQILNKAANWQLTTAVSRQLSALLFSPLLNLTCWAGLIASTASHIPRWGMKWKFSESHHPNFPTPFVSYHLIKHHLEQQLKLQCWFCCIPRLPNWSLKTWTNPNTLAFFFPLNMGDTVPIIFWGKQTLKTAVSPHHLYPSIPAFKLHLLCGGHLPVKPHWKS